jgi:hypothetical protein
VTTAATDAAVLGKVPWHPEFLVGSQPSPELFAFDQWLFRNAQSMADVTEGPSYGFLLQLGPADSTAGAIAGVVSPSQDAAGRHYPLAVAGRVPLARDAAAHCEVLPIVLEAYWHTAVDILKEARLGPPGDGDWRLSRLLQAQTESYDTAFELYADWAERMAASRLCSLLGRPAKWLAEAVATMAQALGPEGGASVRSVRVPLGRAGGAALCFWLDVVRRLASWPARIPSFFWSHNEEGGDALVFIGGPGEGALTTLWTGSSLRDEVCDLTAQDHAADGASTSPVSGSAAEGNLWTVLDHAEALLKMRSP